MKKYTLLALFIVISTINLFGQDTTYFDSKWKESNREESYYYRVDVKEGGLFTRTDFYIENDQIQMQGNYESLDPEIKTGHFVYYHSNGQLKHVGDYKNNKEIGEHLWYYDNGQTEAIETYEYGVLNGRYLEFSREGNTTSESAFLVGQQHGETKYYREDGSFHSEGNFKNGERNGVWKYFDENGELLGTDEFKTEYEIAEASMYIKLPNINWSLTSNISGHTSEYIFKRRTIIDSEGREIIPAIMVYVEDASEYDDLTVYSFMKQKPFIESGIEIDKILSSDDDEYPISYKSSYWYKCHYNDGEFDHILYMVHVIDKEKHGIQIYMDMTKDIADEYEQEFIETLKSIRPL